MTTLVSVLFLGGNIIEFIEKSGSTLFIDLKGLTRIAGEAGTENLEKLIPVTVILILIPLFSVASIFLFRKRKIQMKLTILLIILIVFMILILSYFNFTITRKYNAEIIPGIKLILPVLMLISSILAYKGIRRDEKLVRSYDRIR